MAIPEGAQIVALIGTAIGSGIAAYYSNRSEKRSKTVQTEVNGPGDEPSLRDMLKTAKQETFDQYQVLNTNLGFVSERLKQVEHLVNTGVEQRLQVLEKREAATEMVAAHLKSIDDRVSGLSEDVTRAGFNLHELAQAAQVKLFTREEARIKARAIQAQKEGQP